MAEQIERNKALIQAVKEADLDGARKSRPPVGQVQQLKARYYQEQQIVGSGQWTGRAVARFHLFSGSANSRHPDPTKEEREDGNYRVLPVIIKRIGDRFFVNRG